MNLATGIEGMTWADIGALVSAMVAAVSAFLAARATRHVHLQVKAQEKATEAQAFMQIYEQWNAIYPTYRKLLADDVPWAEVKATADVRDFMKTDTWMRIRSVLVFYEFIAGLTKRGMLNRGFLHDLVNVNPDLWAKYKDLVYYLREHAKQKYLYIELENQFFKPAGSAP